MLNRNTTSECYRFQVRVTKPIWIGVGRRVCAAPAARSAILWKYKHMTDLCRIGVALSADLLEKFDKLIAQRGYTNRSEAFRDLIRNELVQEAWKSSDSEVFGTVTLVYDHHARLLPEKLTELQHHYHAAVVSALHVHLDHDNCLEVVLVKGKAGLVEKLSNALIAIKGVKHGRFTVTTSGHDLP